MRFDVLTFLRRHAIPHTLEGNNVKRDNVNVKCPFCGVRDPSMHLGIDLETAKWGCWRDQAHRGNNIARLIRALLHCSWEKALEIVGAPPPSTNESLDSLRSRLQRPTAVTSSTSKMEFDRGFFELSRQDPRVVRFHEYLISRGFAPEDIQTLCHHYGLRGALSGRFAWRLILPFYANQQLLGWTGRSIAAAELRYLSHPSSSVVKELVFNQEECNAGGETLVLVEGPLDCLKVDFYGAWKGFRACGLLGTAVTQTQISVIASLSQRFERLLVLLDSDAQGAALRLSSCFPGIEVRVGSLPEGVKDPGELDPTAVERLLQRYR